MSPSYMKGKKAQGPEALVDVLSVLFIVLVFVIFFAFINLRTATTKVTIEGAIASTGDQISFLNYLKSDAGNGKSMADLIAESFVNGNYDSLTEKSKALLNKMYSREMRWSIYINDELKMKEKGANEKNAVIDSEATLPIFSGDAIKFRLVVSR